MLVAHVLFTAIIQTLFHLGFHDQRVRSWALPTFNATLMSLYGIPYFLQWIFVNDLSTTLSTTHIAQQLQAYMIIDLFYNGIVAPQKLLEFWVHHIVYTIVLSYAVAAGYTGIICTYLLLEVPAAIRAWGTLVPAWRADGSFGLLFFLLRVVLPFLILGRDAHVYPPVAFPIFAAMQILHIYWFYLWCRSQLPRLLAEALGARDESQDYGRE